MYNFPGAEDNTCLFSFNFKGRTWFEKAYLYISIESHGLSQVEKLKNKADCWRKCSFKRQRPRLFYPFAMQSATLLRLFWNPMFLAEGWCTCGWPEVSPPWKKHKCIGCCSFSWGHWEISVPHCRNLIIYFQISVTEISLKSFYPRSPHHFLSCSYSSNWTINK